LEASLFVERAVREGHCCGLAAVFLLNKNSFGFCTHRNNGTYTLSIHILCNSPNKTNKKPNFNSESYPDIQDKEGTGVEVEASTHSLR